MLDHIPQLILMPFLEEYLLPFENDQLAAAARLENLFDLVIQNHALLRLLVVTVPKLTIRNTALESAMPRLLRAVVPALETLSYWSTDPDFLLKIEYLDLSPTFPLYSLNVAATPDNQLAELFKAGKTPCSLRHLNIHGLERPVDAALRAMPGNVTSLEILEISVMSSRPALAQLVSAASLANRSLRWLNFGHPRVQAPLLHLLQCWGLVENARFAEIDRLCRDKFVVPLSRLRNGGESLWSSLAYDVFQFPIDLYTMDPLRALCHPPNDPPMAVHHDYLIEGLFLMADARYLVFGQNAKWFLERMTQEVNTSALLGSLYSTMKFLISLIHEARRIQVGDEEPEDDPVRLIPTTALKLIEVIIDKNSKAFEDFAVLGLSMPAMNSIVADFIVSHSEWFLSGKIDPNFQHRGAPLSEHLAEFPPAMQVLKFLPNPITQ